MTTQSGQRLSTSTSMTIILLTMALLSIAVNASVTSIKDIDVNSMDASKWKICSEVVADFKTPCLCAKTLQIIDATENALTVNGSNNYIMFNCDRVSLPGDVPSLPSNVPIRGFSHQHGSLQSLDQQLFSEHNLNLTWVDFSHNHLHRLSDRLLEAVKSTLEEIRLGHNYLGHQLNPIFATNAFKPLSKLRILDLSHNMIRALDDDLLQGLNNLEELNLEGNNFKTLPKAALRNLPQFTTLHFQSNHIDKLRNRDFSEIPTLQHLNLTRNVVNFIENEAFLGLRNLTTLDLSSNMLKFITDENVFEDMKAKLSVLDLSDNFMGAIPSEALRPLQALKILRLASNGIRTLRMDDFAELSSLQQLDLSRNRITELPPTVFARLTNLNVLLLDVNLLLKVEDPAFNGLENLHHLSMNDNTILGLPTTTLGSLSTLKSLALSFNRISAISVDLFWTIQHLEDLYFEFNLVREIPDGTFQNFTDLKMLSFRGNHIKDIHKHSLIGTEHTLVELDLSINKLSEYPDFPHFLVLEKLDLSNNDITYLPEDALAVLSSIKELNLRQNKLTELTVSVFNPPTPSSLQHLNLAKNSINKILPDTFITLTGLRTLDLSQNNLKDIKENTFYGLPQLKSLDLSQNDINVIHPSAFGADIASLQTVNFSHNHLTVLDGGIITDIISTLQVLDVSHNHIHYLMPNSFLHMLAVKKIYLNNNKLVQFLQGILGDMPYLEELHLQHNHIQQVASGQFSHAKRLRTLDLSYNDIETLGEGIFYNSSQVELLNFSHNKLETVPHGAFEGIARLQLDISHNNLSTLPMGLFSRNKVKNLQRIDLSHNLFRRLPLAALNEQYGSLEDLIASNNQITHVPSNTNIMLNVKYIDLSDNPLNEDSLQNIFAEPKTVRELKLTSCNIKSLPALETPFLRLINLSNNIISSVESDTFQRTTLLEVLDLSSNHIENLTETMSPIWHTITGLKHLDLSRNTLKEVGPNVFSRLTHLEFLSLSQLSEMGRFDEYALNGLTNLKSISIYGYPRLGFYDIHSLLNSLSALESLEVEIKTMVLREQLHSVYKPRLRRLVIYGKTLRNLTSVSFAGLLAPNIDISIHNTSLTTIPNTIFLPLPASSIIRFDLADNQISKLGLQMLMTLSEKKNQVTVKRLDRNPLFCDCFMKPMHTWLQENLREKDNNWANLKCAGPEELQDQVIAQLQNKALTCERSNATTTSPLKSTSNPITTSILHTTTTTEVIAEIFHDTPLEEEEVEPDIIYEAPTPRQHPAESNTMQGSLTNMDSMIIGIIVGVVAFICILIVIICTIKLRHSRVRYRASPMQIASIHGACTCVKPPFQSGNNHPNYSHDTGSLPPKNRTGSMSSLPRSSYYHNHHQYFASYPESETDYR